MRKRFAVFILRADLPESDRGPHLQAFEKPVKRNVCSAHEALHIDPAVSPENEALQRHRFGRPDLQRQSVLASSNEHAKLQSGLSRCLLNLWRTVPVRVGNHFRCLLGFPVLSALPESSVPPEGFSFPHMIARNKKHRRRIELLHHRQRADVVEIPVVKREQDVSTTRLWPLQNLPGRYESVALLMEMAEECPEHFHGDTLLRVQHSAPQLLAAFE